jgi:EAL domain-containing protein (putative c-di-GMP-specific phosphodiesterase class I)
MNRGLRSRRAWSAPPPNAFPFDSVQIVLQPIVEVSTGRLVAAEALARFPSLGHPPVDEVFAVAHASGSGADLEAACVRLALSKRHEMPDGVMLSVNVSPDALSDPGVQQALSGDLTGVIVELTEHAATDPHILDRLLAEVRRRGALIAVDDLSTGYAGLLRLTTLRPDIVKLDRTLITGVRDSPDQTAVIEALTGLSRWIGARLIAEGVETLDDLSALAELDVDYAQGWVIAPPALELPQIATQSVTACRAARHALLASTAAPPIAGSITGLQEITAALAGTAELGALHTALTAAAASLAIDVIGLSILTDHTHLREVTAIGDPVDPRSYPLADFPATRSALLTGAMVEAHVDDPHTDAAERAVLAEFQLTSLLIAPLIGNGTPLGILEFSHRTPRRWTSHDLKQARTLADHVTSVLLRLGHTLPQSTPGLVSGTPGGRSPYLSA